MVYEDGSSEKFQASRWMEKLKNEKFRARVLTLMDDEVILKFEKRDADASSFYDIDKED